jgi:hypothetical protein
LKPKIWTRLQLSHFWLALAVAALFVSGFFALFISAAKIPGLAQFLTQIDFFRRALVVHVDLSVVVWFMCMPVALFHFLYQAAPVKLWMRFCYSCALAGVLLFALAGFFPDGRPLLSNYIPVTTHPLYLAGLLLFMTAVALNYISAFSKEVSPVFKQLNIGSEHIGPLKFGVRLGSVYFLAGVAVLLFTVPQLPMSYREEGFYEMGVWAFGHLQQFSNLIFMMVSWILLLSSWSEARLYSRRLLIFVFGWLSLPLLISLFLIRYSPMDYFYRQGFTELMRWGTFPPALILLIAILAVAFRERKKLNFKDYRFQIFVWSAGLLVIGFIFGALVRGPDLRLPGHYHATIGAVTLSFMGSAFVLLDGIRNPKPKFFLRKLSPILYGLGQLGFASGMFISGSFGMGRKIYGVEQQIHNLGQQVGLVVMGLGGILALAGGFAFALASLPSILGLDKVRSR